MCCVTQKPVFVALHQPASVDLLSKKHRQAQHSQMYLKIRYALASFRARYPEQMPGAQRPLPID